MLHRALIHDRHRLESAMGMFAHAARLVGRRKVCGSGVVEHQERTDDLSEPVRGKEVAHFESVADPMLGSRPINAHDSLPSAHCVLPDHLADCT
jgi:hypothetical protein